MPSARKLIEKFSDLKTLPHVAIRVTQMVNSESSTMQDFEEIIKLDPILVVRLLKLVNSPYFGLANRVEDIAKAVVFVGMKNLRNLVAVEALRDLFKDNKGSSFPAFSRHMLWVHSATVAILCQMIAKRIFGLDGENEFLAGIIHDIGLIVEDQLLPRELRQAAELFLAGDGHIIEYEQETFGTHHAKVGGVLAGEWNMPEEVLEAIKKHHDYNKPYPIPSVTSIIHIGEYIANRLEYGALKGRVDALPSYLKGHMKERMAEYKVLIKDLPGEMTKATELYADDPAQE